jgi:alkylated DNA repair dioxygenase AlkB
MSLKRKTTTSSIISITTKKSRKSSPNQLIDLSAVNEPKTIYLNDDETSWIKLQKLAVPSGLTLAEFEELFRLKPEEKLKIKIAGKEIYCPRYSKSYLKAYKFSGLNHEAESNLPKRVQKLLEYSQTLNKDLNQCLINWYEPDGSIGKHSDDTKQLKNDSEIFSFSFGPAVRTFILEPKEKTERNKIYHVKLEHNVLVVMGGKCQETHYHSVPKMSQQSSEKDGRRLNVTFRCFK